MSLGTDVLSRIGHTPLLRLRAIERSVPHVTLLAKAEWFNPGGSVKDRAAWSIVRAAERSGQLTREQILLDATSGNTGIAYAMIGAAKGYRVTLCVPSNVSQSTLHTLRAYGAELVLTNPLEGSDGAIVEARRIAGASPGRYYYADQYGNAANWRAHYETTGVEIWEQTQGQVSHLVAGMGTSGTLMGTGRRLKAYNPSMHVVALEPDSPLNGLEGLKHMASSIVPGIYDPAFPDQHLEIATDEAYQAARRLAREEGLLVGPSSGAALAGALQVARAIEQGTIVMIFPDGGQKYLHETFWTSDE